jgi:hypothetical protein
MRSRLYFLAAEVVEVLGLLLEPLGLVELAGVVEVVELLEQALTTTRASATAGTESVLARKLLDIFVLLWGLRDFVLSLPQPLPISRR